MRKTGFPGVLGAIDCTHIAIIAPVKEEHTYINRKGYHSKNVQIICDYNLKILNINAGFGGSAHDSFIWISIIHEELERRCNEGDQNTWLLGDSGYPQQLWLMRPILNAAEGTPEFNYTQRHMSARNCVERCNGVLKGRFRCLLGERKLRYKPTTVADITVSCAILHNICVEGRVVQQIDPNEIPYPQDELNIGHQLPRDNIGFQARRNLVARYFNN